MEDLNKYIPETTNWKKYEDILNKVAMYKAYEEAIKFYDLEQRHEKSQPRDANRLFSIMMSKSKGTLKSQDVKDFLYVATRGLFLV